MSSVLRPVRKRKKSRKLGPVDVIRREDYGDLELDAKVELIRSLVPLGLMHVEEMLDDEVTALAGARYARKDASIGGRRHGSNPGTVGLAGQRVPIRVPRIRRVAGARFRCGPTPRCMARARDRLLTRVYMGFLPQLRGRGGGDSRGIGLLPCPGRSSRPVPRNWSCSERGPSWTARRSPRRDGIALGHDDQTLPGLRRRTRRC